MDAYYYLMAQLPALVPGRAPVMGAASFLELCEQLLPPQEYAAHASLSLTPQPGQSHPFTLAAAWYRYEISLRNQLAALRAQCLSRAGPPVDGEADLRSQADARAATGFDSPLEAEIFLIDRRLAVLDELQGTAWFNRDSAAAYLLKTMLLERRALFREEEGFSEYKRIYAAIMEHAAQGVPASSISSGLGEQ